ncbi:4-aminobutyrate--2-oxoglutarate transaminase [Micromonospora wenchangensis]|uniref:4-aminobutyrate--2-oxoglutarate transaminase n=1 Tax=Micromonospora wenchangensis TaxID=1185415 RepID=UPI0033FD3931
MRAPQSRTEDSPAASSAELHRRRGAAVARGVGSVIDSYVDTASGGTIVDVEGREWIDFAAGIAVTSVGNAAPRVVEAVRAQVERFTHTCFMVAPYESYVAVCEQLNALTPGTFAKRSALFNSGAEAVENAVKIARHATGRQAVVVFEHAYHGRTNLTMALTAKNMPYKHRFGPFAGEVHRVPMSYPLRDGGLSGAQAAARALELVDKQVGAENVAALLIEPIQGEGGFVVPATGFLPALREWATAAGAVFVADEIQTGFCRTGDWFACDHEGVVPDLVTLAKGIAGGLPLAAVTGRAELMDAVHVGGLGGTYGGNPIACAAALASIATMRELDLAAAARRIGSVLADRLRAVAARDPRIAEVRGRGAMLAVELVRPGGLVPDPAAASAVSAACHAAGLLTLTCGTYGNVLRFLPPLVISDDELARGLDILDAAFG